MPPLASDALELDRNLVLVATMVQLEFVLAKASVDRDRLAFALVIFDRKFDFGALVGDLTDGVLGQRGVPVGGAEVDDPVVDHELGVLEVLDERGGDSRPCEAACPTSLARVATRPAPGIQIRSRPKA